MKVEQLYSSVEGLRQSGSIIFEAVAGSQSYGTNTPESDLDLRGLFILPQKWHLSIFNPPEEVAIDKQDIKFYELKKFITLAADANPNIIEMLWPPADCIRIMTPAMEKLIANRHLFVSTKAFHTFSGYSFSQIQKAKGQNKMVHDEGRFEPGIALLQDYYINGKITADWMNRVFASNVVKAIMKGGTLPLKMAKKDPSDDVMFKFLEKADIVRLQRPTRQQFCWFIPTRRFGLAYHIKTRYFPMCGENKWPVRPEPLHKAGIDLSKYHAAALEHIDGLYRLYHYGAKAKGVFRGDGLLVLESIPVKDEWTKFKGLLLYNDNAYKEAVRDWERYFDWRANRNEARWSGKDGTNFDFDHKNMMHCMRLLLSGENILTHGEPIVRFQGEQLEYLRNIRNGKLPYEKIMAEVEHRMANLEEVKKLSPLPHSADRKKINRLYLDIVDEWESNHPVQLWE